MGRATARREDRCDAISYEEVLEQDTRSVPDYLKEQMVPDLGTEAVSAERYTSPDFYREEVDKMWLKAWQFACREEEIPNVGDYVVYDNVGKSLLVVRSAPDQIKALVNVCLHRGRKLATHGGCKQAFRCPFHGFTWNIDGSFKENPIKWDFPQVNESEFKLPEAKVDTWGGFVFVNFDTDAPPLQEVLHPIPAHFERYDLANTYKWVHVAKKFPANWKVVSEAFMESHHSVTTHPQILPYLADANSKYDVYSNFVTRHFSAMGVSSPLIDGSRFSEDDILDSMFGTSGRMAGKDKPGLKVPEGMTARTFGAEMLRQAFSAEDGHDYSDKSDAEMLDPLLYNVFPNMSFWAGFGPNLVYRWRPIDVDNTIMEIIRLKRVPKDGPRPKPCQVHWLTDDEPFTAAEELGPLGQIFDQDMSNLPFVQEGLKASGNDQVHFGKYSEMRIRRHHQTLDWFLGR